MQAGGHHVHPGGPIGHPAGQIFPALPGQLLHLPGGGLRRGGCQLLLLAADGFIHPVPVAVHHPADILRRGGIGARTTTRPSRWIWMAMVRRPECTTA